MANRNGNDTGWEAFAAVSPPPRKRRGNGFRIFPTIFLASVMAVVAPAIAVSQPLAGGGPERRPLTVSQWRDDFTYLVRTLRERHAEPFVHISEEAFHRQLNGLAARAPELSRDQIFVELSRIVALLRDEHTELSDGGLDFHELPIQLWMATDGIVIVSAEAAFRDLIGAKILEVGSTPIADALARLMPCAARDGDNRWGAESNTMDLLVTAEMLRGAGITDSIDTIRLLVEDSDETTREVMIKPLQERDMGPS